MPGSGIRDPGSGVRAARGHRPEIDIAVYDIFAAVTPRPAHAEDPESFLPLHRDTFHILVSLADRDRHGYAVMQDVLERTDGKLRLSPSSLYASIRRLLEQDLIEELDERPDPAHDDERRRYYRLTRLGREVAKAEARRLERLLGDARATGLLPRRT
jgi:DNA-binding PadR family transcriptional regulator